jgi:hypothetical protein
MPSNKAQCGLNWVLVSSVLGKESRVILFPLWTHLRLLPEGTWSTRERARVPIGFVIRLTEEFEIVADRKCVRPQITSWMGIT